MLSCRRNSQDLACLISDVFISGDDVDKTMQFASVKIGGTSGEPFHKNQKLKWDHKVLYICFFRCGIL